MASNMVALEFFLPVDTGANTFSNNQASDWGADPVLSWIVEYGVAGTTNSTTVVSCTGLLENPCTVSSLDVCPGDIGGCGSSLSSYKCIVPNLTPAISYSMTVRAVNPQGQSAASVSTTVTTLSEATVPGTPDMPSMKWVTGTSVQLSISTSSGSGSLFGAPLNHGKSQISGYDVQIFQGGETPIRTVSFASTCTTVVISGLTANTDYSFKTVVKNTSNQVSEASASLSVKTEETNKQPEAVAAPSVKWFTSTSVYLTWTPPPRRGTTQITNYRIVIPTGGRTTNSVITTPDAKPCFVVNGLTPGAGKTQMSSEAFPNLYGPAYQFGIVASNQQGFSDATPATVTQSLPRGLCWRLYCVF